jgi:hypothetical protein
MCVQPTPCSKCLCATCNRFAIVGRLCSSRLPVPCSQLDPQCALQVFATPDPRCTVSCGQYCDRRYERVFLVRASSTSKRDNTQGHHASELHLSKGLWCGSQVHLHRHNRSSLLGMMLQCVDRAVMLRFVDCTDPSRCATLDHDCADSTIGSIVCRRATCRISIARCHEQHIAHDELCRRSRQRKAATATDRSPMQRSTR